MANLKVKQGVDFEAFLDKIDTSSLSNGLTSRFLSEVQRITAIKAVAHPAVDIKLDNIKIHGTKIPAEKILQKLDLEKLTSGMNHAVEKGFSKMDDSAVLSMVGSLTKLGASSHMASKELEHSAKNAQAFANGFKPLSAFSRAEVSGLREYLSLLQGVGGQIKSLRNDSGKHNDLIPEHIRKELFEARKDLGQARLAKASSSDAYEGAGAKKAAAKLSLGEREALRESARTGENALAAANKRVTTARNAVDVSRAEHSPAYNHYIQQMFNQVQQLEKALKPVFDDKMTRIAEDTKATVAATSKIRAANAKSKDTLEANMKLIESKIGEIDLLRKNAHTSDVAILDKEKKRLQGVLKQDKKSYQPHEVTDRFYQSSANAQIVSKLRPEEKLAATKDRLPAVQDLVNKSGYTSLASDSPKLKELLAEVKSSTRSQRLNPEQLTHLSPTSRTEYDRRQDEYSKMVEGIRHQIDATASNPFQKGFDSQLEGSHRRLNDDALGARIRDAIQKGQYNALSSDDINLAKRQYGKRGTTLEGLLNNKSYDGIPGVAAVPGLFAENKKVLDNLEKQKVAAKEAEKILKLENQANKRATEIGSDLVAIQNLRKSIKGKALDDLLQLREDLRQISHKLSPTERKALINPALIQGVKDVQLERGHLLSELRAEIIGQTPKIARGSDSAKVAQLQRGSELASQYSHNQYTSLPREAMPDLQAHHKAGERQALNDLNNAQRTGADTRSIEKDLHSHRAGMAAASEAAKKYRTELGLIGHAFETLSRYGAVSAILYGTASAFKAVVASVIELEDEMKNIQAITSSSETDMAVIGASIKGIATTTAFSISEIAGAVKTVAQAGVEMKDIPKTVQAIADVATATGSQLQTAADIITTVKEVWDGIDVSTIGDRVSQAVNISKLQIEDLKTILSLNAAAAKSANVSLEQSLSLDALLRNAGVKASTIATGSTQMYRELFSPDKKFSEFLSKQYGRAGEKVSSEEAAKKFSDFRSSSNPILEAVSELNRIGVGDHQSIVELERSIDSRALNVFKPLLNSKENLTSLEAQMRAGSTAAEGAATASLTVSKSLGNLKDQIEVFSEAMGEPLLKPLREFIDGLKEGIKKDVEVIDANVTDEKIRERDLERRGSDVLSADGFTSGARVLSNKVGRHLANAADYLLSDSDQEELKAASDWISETYDKAFGMAKMDIPYDSGVKPGAGMASLEEQFKNSQVQIDKDRESFKNYLPGKDSSANLLTIATAEFEGISKKFSDVFGGVVKQDDLNSLVDSVAKLKGMDVRKPEYTATIQDIQKKTGGNKKFSDTDLNSVVTSADTIKGYLSGLLAQIKQDISVISENTDTETKVGKLRKEFLDKQLENKDFKDATVLGKDTPASKQIELISGFTSAMAEEAKKSVVSSDTVMTDHIKKMAVEVALATTEFERNGSLVKLQKLISEVTEDAGTGVVHQAGEAAIKLINDLDSADLSPPGKLELSSDIRSAIESARVSISDVIGKDIIDIYMETNRVIAKANASDSKTDLDKSNIAQAEALQVPLATKLSAGSYTGAEGGGVAKHKGIINKLSGEFGFNPNDIAALFTTESHGNPTAVSEDGATGLGQLMPKTFKGYLPKGDINNPEDNARAGLMHLDYLRKNNPTATFNELAMGYNTTPQRFAKYMKDNRHELMPETQNHGRSVEANLKTILDANQKNSDKNTNGLLNTGKFEKAQGGGFQYTKESKDLVKQLDTKFTKLQPSKDFIDFGSADLPEVTDLQDRKLKLEEEANGFKSAGNTPAALVKIKEAYTLGSELLTLNKEYLDENVYKIPEAAEKKGKVTKLYKDLEAKKRSEEKAYQASVDTAQHKGESIPFNTNEPKFVKNEEYKRQIDKLLDTLELQKNEFSEARKALIEQGSKLDTENTQMQIDHTSGKYVSELNKGQHYSVDAEAHGDRAAALRPLTQKLKDDQDKAVKAVEATTSKKLINAFQSVVKAVEKELESNALALDEAQALGNSEVVKTLLQAQGELDLRLHEATIKRIEADKTSTTEDIDAANTSYKNKLHTREKERVSANIGTRESRLQAIIGDPVEGFTRSGRQEALGHSQYLPDQKAENARNTAAYQDRLINAQSDLNSAKNPESIKKFEDEVNAATQELAKLNTVAEDLAPTLSNQLDQISTENIVAEIDNLQGSLKNLDKNITSRVVQFADKFSTDVADSAVTAAEGLLGFNTATKEATDSLINLAQKQGDLALVKTDRVQLAQNIQSIRMNEADPVRQEMLIKSAEASQKQAEDIAAFQVEEAQKAADKVAFDNSLAGKLQGGVKDLAEGVAKDVIKSEVLGMFTETLGGSATKPMYVEVVNSPAFGLDAVSKNDPTLTGGGANKGFFSGLGAKVSGLFGNSTEAVDNTPTYAYPTDAGQSVFTPAPEIAGVSTVTPLADTGSYDPVMTPIGVNGEAMASQAQGAGEIPVAVESGAAIGVETGFGNIFDSAKGIFDDFSSSMTGSWTTFIGSLSATLGVLGSQKKKMGGFEIAQMVVGGIGMVAGAVASGGAAAKGLFGANGTFAGGTVSQTLGYTQAAAPVVTDVPVWTAPTAATGGMIQDGVVQHFATGANVQNYSTGGNVESANVQNYSTGGNVESANVQNYSTGGTPIYDPKTGTTQLYPDQTQHGYITGPGTTTSDSIPARLSNGEYVLNAKTTKAIGKRTLDAWNFANKFPIQRATGGIADPMSYAASRVQPNAPVVAPSAPTEQSIRVVMVDDHRNVGDYISSASGEKTLVEFVRRNSLSIKQILR